CSTISILGGLQRLAKISVLFVEFRDHHDAWNDELISIGPRLFSLHFDAFDAVDDDDGAVCDAKCGSCMCDECSVSGSIYKVDLCIAVFEMCECGIECDLASDGIFFVIGNCGAFIYLSPARCGSGDVEKRADELRLPCVAMSNDSKISDSFGRIDFHMFDSFQACEIWRRIQ